MTKLIFALILSILFLIFIIQNLHTIELHFLFWQFNGSLALILLLTFIVTLIISSMAAIPLMMKRKSNKVNKSPEINPKERQKTKTT